MRKGAPSTIYYIIFRSRNTILSYAPIFSEILDGITDECTRSGCRVRTIQINEETDNINEVLEQLRLKDCAGMIFLGTEFTAQICSMFASIPIPKVILDTYFESVEASYVQINNIRGAYSITNYMIGRCNAQPGHLRSSFTIPNFTERQQGFFHALSEHGMNPRNSTEFRLSPTLDGAFSDMLEIIESGKELDRCYFADNDLIAIGAIKALKLRGYRIPEDIAIAGFDNIMESRIIEPALTTVDIPRKYMGQAATRLLLSQIKNPSHYFCKVEVATSLRKRYSV